jgi:hypothetical protein
VSIIGFLSPADADGLSSKIVDSHLKPYRCKVDACVDADTRFSSTACLLRHEREAHQMHSHSDRPYLCPYEGCDRSKAGNGFPRAWNLKDHARRVHNDNGNPYKPEVPASPVSDHVVAIESKGRKRKISLPSTGFKARETLAKDSSGTDSPGRDLACPFYKVDPVQHRNCYTLRLTRVRDVKQHLYRRHAVDFFCPVCMEKFASAPVRDMHIRDRICEAKPYVRHEWITTIQKVELAKRVPQTMSIEQQWFSVFDIVFPDHPQPRSPYVDRETPEQVAAFRDYLTGPGVAGLWEYLRRRRSGESLLGLGMDFATRASDERLLADGIGEVCDSWMSQNMQKLLLSDDHQGGAGPLPQEGSLSGAAVGLEHLLSDSARRPKGLTSEFASASTSLSSTWVSDTSFHGFIGSEDRRVSLTSDGLGDSLDAALEKVQRDDGSGHRGLETWDLGAWESGTDAW